MAKNKNYGAFILTATMTTVVAIFIMVFLFPFVTKLWQIMFTKPSVGSMPTWSFVVIGLFLIMMIGRKNRRGAYI